MKDDITVATVKAAPPVAVTAYNYVLGMPIEKWVSVATLIYIILQAYFLVRDKMRKRRKGDE
jgi:hypothetical protein